MRRWAVLAVTVAAILVGLALAGQREEAQAQPREVPVEPVRAKPVAPGVKLWVFVYPEHRGRPGGDASAYCTDGNQTTLVPKFANANASGLTFNINPGSIPIDKNAATQAIHEAFGAWDAVAPGTYFTINDTGGASGPAMDGNNTVGWAFLVPKTTLAAAWVWTDDNGNVTEADVFYNALHKWGVFTTCNGQAKYEVGNVGVHEFGHVVGLDHLADPGAYASLYPSASKGEVRKRSLTDGDIAGYLAAGGY